MSTTHRPAAQPTSTDRTVPTPSVSADRPTATFPTGQWLADQAAIEQAHRERLADLWEDATPTEPLPVVGPQPAAGRPRTERAERTERTKPARRRHLHAALAGLLIAAALLTGMQLYAAAGISSARQAALQSARESAGAHAYSTPSDAAPSRPEQAAPEHEGGQQSPMSGQTPAPATMSDRTSAAPMSGQTDTQSEWVTQDTGAPYVRTNPHASPLSLPRCTTSPTTPMPCLAHVSANSRHAVVLEEDGSLTGLVHSHTR